MRQPAEYALRTFALRKSQDSSDRARNPYIRNRAINKRRKLHMQIEHEQTSVAQSTTQVYPTTPSNAEDARNRAARLAQSADSLIDRILSGDSRAFLDANRQTGGE
jgi:hypothetical protein